MLTLANLKQYLKAQSQASLAELAHYFAESPETVQDRMRHFINKGQVHCNSVTPKCATLCQKCELKNVIIYTWV